MYMDMENVFTKIGSFGVRHRFYFLLLSLKELFIAGPIMHIVFMSIKPDSFQCISTNGTVYANSCPDNDISRCSMIAYKYTRSSVITEWNLICSDAYKLQLTQSIYMAGVLVGAIIFGYFSDIFGRKIVYLSTIIAVAFYGSLGSFSPTYSIYVLIRFLTGMHIQGATLTGYVLLLELVGTSIRGAVATWIGLTFTFGLILMTVISYLCHDWRVSSFMSSVWGFTFIFHFMCLPESPRWLFATGQKEKAEAVLFSIAKGNKREKHLPTKWSLKEQQKPCATTNVDSLLAFAFNWKLFKYLAIQIYSWFVTSAMYYGLMLAAGSLGDIFWSTVLLSLVEVPAVFIQASLINRIGRKKLLCGFMFCGGISCFAIQFLPSTPAMPIVRTLFALTGKLCASGQFGVVYIYSAEIFPTSIRNSAMGVVAVAARVGGILTPFIVLLGDYVTNLHFTVLGAMAFTAGIFNLGLPETNKKPLPDTLDNLLHPEKFQREVTVIVDADDEEYSKDTDAMLHE